MKWMVPIAAAMGLALFGCDRTEVVVHPEGDEAWEMAHSQQVDEEEVVARVDGQAITVADVEEAWRHQPERSAEEVLDGLIEREILAMEAKERGYHERPEVSFSRKQGMVSALLADEVEAPAEPDESKKDELLQFVERTRRAPEGLRATHLVILVPDEIEDEDGAKKRLRGEAREAYYERGMEYVEQVLDYLGDEVDDDALRQAARYFNDEVFDGDFEAVVNEHMRFPRAGETYDPDHLPQGWTGVVDAFSEGADLVAGEDRIGELSEPVRTRFGWHLIRVLEVIPEQVVDPDAAEAYVDHELRVRARESLLQERMQQWAEGVPAQVYPERLGSAFDDDR